MVGTVNATGRPEAEEGSPPLRSARSASLDASDATGTGVDTYSRTLWAWSGGKKGLLVDGGGAAASEGVWEAKGMLGRELEGLKRPGDETGVLLADLCGVCEEWEGKMS